MMKITGFVQLGMGEAKKMGFPTLNISPKKIPKNFSMGVYAVRVRTPMRNFCGIAYYGPRFGHKDSFTFEAHCFGLKKNLLHIPITVEIVKRIRGVKKFKSVADAKKCIRRDIAKAKKILKNAIILHGFGNTPSQFWYPYIKKQLEKRGYDVWVPHLPGAANPTLKKWLPFVFQNGFFSDETILIGHSAGAPLILSILESISVTIKKAILVSGFMEPQPLCANDLLKAKYDWRKIRSHAGRIICINSDNDPWGCDDKQGRKIAKAAAGKFIFMRGEGHMGSATFHQPYRTFSRLLKLI
ncbi:alpha/beta hydrolase [Candidatus Peregrinibacteria bacterium]|nr:alpha/beta hydrolase [Candidatus Peregrinibacteria bacterium]